METTKPSRSEFDYKIGKLPYVFLFCTVLISHINKILSQPGENVESWGQLKSKRDFWCEILHTASYHTYLQEYFRYFRHSWSTSACNNSFAKIVFHRPAKMLYSKLCITEKAWDQNYNQDMRNCELDDVFEGENEGIVSEICTICAIIWVMSVRVMRSLLLLDKKYLLIVTHKISIHSNTDIY